MTGLLDARGAEIASYTYDAWGNVITDTEKSFCYEEYEVPFELNHVLYRGYYYDGSCTDTESDTNLYYLQSRYYDAEVGRFINAALSAWTWGMTGGNIFKIKRYVGMVQKAGAGTLEIKLLRAFYKMRSLIVNMVVKSFGKRKGESWFTAIKRFVSYAANKI